MGQHKRSGMYGLQITTRHLTTKKHTQIQLPGRESESHYPQSFVTPKRDSLVTGKLILKSFFKKTSIDLRAVCTYPREVVRAVKRTPLFYVAQFTETGAQQLICINWPFTSTSVFEVAGTRGAMFRSFQISAGKREASAPLTQNARSATAAFRLSPFP